METVLVTGGAGFIGSHLIRRLLNFRSDLCVINMDNLTYAGNLQNLQDIARRPCYHFVRGDIREKADVENVFSQYCVDWVINFAAQTHVDRSIQDAHVFFETNVLGAQTLLESAVRHWRIAPGGRRYKDGVRFVQISTDEVYGESLDGTGFLEAAPLLPRNPYAASKAAADLMVRAYRETYNLPVIITRCCNNYGPCQYPEKLIPLAIERCLTSNPIPMYGDGKQKREWLHVGDHCEALLRVLLRGRDGEIYNIGGEEQENIEVVKQIIRLLDRDETLITHVQDRPGHDRRYSLNCEKIREDLGWTRSIPFLNGLEMTVRWYMENAGWLQQGRSPT